MKTTVKKAKQLWVSLQQNELARHTLSRVTAITMTNERDRKAVTAQQVVKDQTDIAPEATRSIRLLVEVKPLQREFVMDVGSHTLAEEKNVSSLTTPTLIKKGIFEVQKHLVDCNQSIKSTRH